MKEFAGARAHTPAGLRVSVVGVSIVHARVSDSPLARVGFTRAAVGRTRAAVGRSRAGPGRPRAACGQPGRTSRPGSCASRSGARACQTGPCGSRTAPCTRQSTAGGSQAGAVEPPVTDPVTQAATRGRKPRSSRHPDVVLVARSTFVANATAFRVCQVGPARRCSVAVILRLGTEGFL